MVKAVLYHAHDGRIEHLSANYNSLRLHVNNVNYHHINISSMSTMNNL